MKLSPELYSAQRAGKSIPCQHSNCTVYHYNPSGLCNGHIGVRIANLESEVARLARNIADKDRVITQLGDCVSFAFNNMHKWTGTTGPGCLDWVEQAGDALKVIGRWIGPASGAHGEFAEKEEYKAQESASHHSMGRGA